MSRAVGSRGQRGRTRQGEGPGRRPVGSGEQKGHGCQRGCLFLRPGSLQIQWPREKGSSILSILQMGKLRLLGHTHTEMEYESDGIGVC